MKTIARVLVIAALLGCLIGANAEAQAKGKSDAWLGVYTQTVNQVLIDDLGLKLPDDKGVLITEIVRDSPADEANLREDDVIIEVDSRPVSTSRELRSIVQEFENGSEITIKIVRDNRVKEITVTLGRQKDSGRNRFAWFDQGEDDDDHDSDHDFNFDFDRSDHGKSGYFGITLGSLTEQLGDYFGVDNGRGALVTEVKLDSPADEAGLKAGDVIIKINDDKINDPGDVSRIVREMEKGEKATVVLIREKNEKEITVEAGQQENRFFGSQFDIDAPGVNLDRIGVPDMRFFGRKHSGDNDLLLYDNDHRSEMEDLRRELRQLQKELKDLRDDLR